MPNSVGLDDGLDACTTASSAQDGNRKRPEQPRTLRIRDHAREHGHWKTMGDTLHRDQAMTANRRKGSATMSGSTANMQSASTCPPLMMMCVANPGGTSAPST